MVTKANGHYSKISTRNFMMHGLEEAEEGEEDDREDTVRALFEKADTEQWRRHCSAYTGWLRRSLTRLAQ